MINDILDFSKIEAGKLGLEVIDFDLHVLLDELFEMMMPQADVQGARDGVCRCSRTSRRV